MARSRFMAELKRTQERCLQRRRRRRTKAHRRSDVWCGTLREHTPPRRRATTDDVNERDETRRDEMRDETRRRALSSGSAMWCVLSKPASRATSFLSAATSPPPPPPPLPAPPEVTAAGPTRTGRRISTVADESNVTPSEELAPAPCERRPRVSREASVQNECVRRRGEAMRAPHKGARTMESSS